MIDIHSKGEYPANVLSNFYPNDFYIDGVFCRSMESFLQSLKFKCKSKQLKICKLEGKIAKEKGSKKKWFKKQLLWWQGKKLTRDGAEYQALLKLAYGELSKNKTFIKALKDTGDKTLTHLIGLQDPTKTILTEKEFCGLLTELRSKKTKRMIVLDLDGTLLRSDKTVSDRTYSALKRCRDYGIKIVYATARGATAKKLAPCAHFDSRIIANGAIVYSKMTRSCLVPAKQAREILIACDKHGLKSSAMTDDFHYMNFPPPPDWIHVENYELTDFADFDKAIEKLCIIVKNKEDEDFIQSLLPDDLYMCVTHDRIAMVMNKDATKAKAVTDVARAFGIKLEDIVAFGDDVNDIEMLEMVGIGVAMGNALDSVKAVADQITLSNDEDGVAAWIESNMII